MVSVAPFLTHSVLSVVMDRPIRSYWCGFLFFFLFSVPILRGRRLDVYHTSTHDVALVRI